MLAQAVSGTAGVILSNGDNDINLDFADLKTVMSHKGMALMGVGEHEGENAAYEAIKAAIESPLLDNVSINGAMGVLVHFYMHPNFPMMEINDAMIVVQRVHTKMRMLSLVHLQTSLFRRIMSRLPLLRQVLKKSSKLQQTTTLLSTNFLRNL